MNAQAPIPSGGLDGYRIGNADAPIQLEVFYDLICPDSKDSWKAMKDVMSHYGPDKLGFTMHRFPLPYHHNAFYAWQGGGYLDSVNSSLMWDWVEQFFGEGFPNQSNFTNAETDDMTQQDVIQAMGRMAELATKGAVSTSDFVNGLSYGNEFDAGCRTSWKYGCSRGVTGTPVWLVNGVQVGADPLWTLKQWIALLDPVISPAAATAEL